MSTAGHDPLLSTPAPSAQAIFVWEDPPRGQAVATSPVLAVDGFAGPLEWLLDLARAKTIDLARLSILDLVDAFVTAMGVAMRNHPGAPALDLARWGDWTVMASDLTLLRSRLLTPTNTADAVAAQAEGEGLRRQWFHRGQTADGADWLERQPQLGFDIFGRGRAEAWQPEHAAVKESGQGADDGDQALEMDVIQRDWPDTPPIAGGDLTDLLRACLVVLRLPLNATAYQLRPLPFWSVSDATARIIQLLDRLPEGAALEAFLPSVAASPNRALRCRAAVVSTFVAGLELTRNGGVTLDQTTAWHAIHIQQRSEGPD